MIINDCTTSGSITVASIYGKMPEIPSGYKAIAFRTVKAGDIYINALSSADLAPMYFSITGPRIILVRDTAPSLESLTWTPPAPKPVTVAETYKNTPKIPNGYELVAFRIPVMDEMVLAFNESIIFSCSQYTEPRLILRRTLQPPAPCTVTVEDVYGKPFADLKLPESYGWATKDGRVEFRMPVDREMYLSASKDRRVTLVADHPFFPASTPPSGPRLILKAKI